MRYAASYGNVAVFPTNHEAPALYAESRFIVHPDGDLEIQSREVATAAIWARGMWQRVEAAK